MVNMNENLKEVFQQALDLARSLRHSTVTVEHFFLMITKHRFGEGILLDCNVNVAHVRKILNDYLVNYIPNNTNDNFNPIQTPALVRVFNKIFLTSENANKNLMGIGDFLVAIMDNAESYSYKILQSMGITREKMVKCVVNADEYGENDEVNMEVTQLNIELVKSPKNNKNDKLPSTNQFAKNLNKLAKMGKIDPLIGRDNEIDKLAQILCRRKKNNPILIGEPGVGKSAIVEGLALRIVEKKVPAKLQNVVIYSIDLNSIVAGTKYRGEFESRLQSIFNEIEKNLNAVIFLDEVHMIVGAGQSQGGNMDMSNILKPRLTSGRLRCIGATTFSDYKTSIDKDKALARRFTKVSVEEPSDDECLLILERIAPIYEKFHNIKYEKESLRSCVFLSSKYISDKHLPDKAIDLMDEIGARVQLNGGNNKKIITKHDIENLLSQITNIPKSTMSTDEKNLLENLESNLKKRIFSQDEAIEKVVQQIMVNKSGLGEINHPIASFLFTGPSGVGKTELSKELAHILGIKFERIDMSEYSESHSVSKLIGSPAGYVGYDDGGLLITKIRTNPHCVLLLDEIEKAHPDIYNILLQIMDDASLSDNKGNKADFKNVILIMTSNAGSKEGNSMGFISDNSNRKQQAIKDIFSPEFRSRLDCVVYFNPLGVEELVNIAIKYLNEINEKIKLKGVKISPTKKVAQLIAKKTIDSALGAREIKKIIDREIKLPLSKIILFEELSSGGNIKISIKNEKIDFQVVSKKVRALS